MAKSPHPNVVWRCGRPRFSPGPELRATGHKGRDLRHEDGRWYSFGEAVDWSRTFAASLPPAAPPPEAELHPATKGFVYFLGIRDRVKIGFSSKPGARLLTLQTSTADPVKFFLVVPGTRYDERRLHLELEAHRSSGEWFRNSLSVIRVMQRHLASHIERLDFQK
ncbi:GIY-YIG nuclease family protein [Mesorhizobium sp. B1-1-7]|uniref:GIY-YIG nuclease family protein n=1 Tax=Mesorhizobium sp. B1-1-7 TaxID=2589977 RepID=UPI00112D3189|nr:GIY-YIG nuclease family protein [Mesorhizobium sp. B1-1-7]TPN57179.1 GIY-YIG nuclease family protein [Mesorhizobium sp. B1-1-7]